MSKTLKRVLCAVLTLCMLVSVFALASCKKDDGTETPTGGDQGNTPAAKKEYTYKTYSTALGTNWNPHTWENSADDSILSYLSVGFVDMSIKNSETGEYQWVYEMATSVKDVTEANQGDLTKYNVTLPEGATADTTKAGYVYEIKLNPNAKWEDGTPINADSYIYSMQQLLNPKMRNYRANLYIAGESALAGAAAYYNSEAPIYATVVPAYGSGETPDYSFDTSAKKVYIHLTAENMTVASYSFQFMLDYYLDETLYKKLNEKANAYGYIEVTEENKADIITAIDQYLKAFGMSIYTDEAKTTIDEGLYKEFLFYFTETYGEKVDYSTVGCYKVDDYTIRYVNQTAIDENYFLVSCTSTWLVHEGLYEANKDTSGELVTTKYGTSKETTMSYGVYKIESLQDAKQLVFVQNENWYGFTKKEDGTLYSETPFLVDGEKRQQYMTTKVVIDVMTNEAAKLAFLKGELDDWSAEGDDLVTYATSDRLYKVDETYTMSFFLNTDLDALKGMDTNEGNVNSVVMSNINFRKAMSLAINRAEFVTATSGYKPAYSLMNSLYFYDVYNDPTSSYRNSDEAMQAICNLYGVKWGENEIYKTLKEAYDSINGYNLTEAKALMKTACEELVQAGIYTKGQDIKIKIGWSAGPVSSADQRAVQILQNNINAALADSGFGTLTFEAIGNIEKRYEDVPNGKYAIGYGAWGGAAFYPFRNFQVYMDPDQYSIHEAACWDPTVHTFTLTVKGEEVTKTAQEWSNVLIGTGEYANEDFDVKLSITAQLEEAFLKLYYRIPLAGSTICSMLSYKVNYYTEDYNIMYGFGGSRLMTYTYDDAAWNAYVASVDGNLNYE